MGLIVSNLYKNPNDYTDWHSDQMALSSANADDEKEMVVVSLSYGKSMPFCWAPNVDRNEVHWEWLHNNGICGSKFSDKKALTNVFLVVLPS